jgi:glycosyltransferase involved in cell wall biosynthesis
MTDDTASPMLPRDSIDNETLETSDAIRLVATPLVSVLMITYNHAEYLAEAIEGIVSQQCGFQFELIIGEDASMDATRRIALDYQQRYPEIIRVIHSAANVGMNANGGRIFSRARGEYVAYCEGDDYWCSPHKLARQVALIRDRADVGIVHTDWVRARRAVDGWKVGWNKSVHSRVPRTLLEGELFRTFHYPRILRTCTILLRRSTLQEFAKSALAGKAYKFGDAVLAAYTASRWKVAYLPEVTAVYRESPNSALRSGKQARLDFLKSSLEFDSDARRFFANRADYPQAYRWEVAVGLFLWSISARNAATAKFALADIRAHFGVISFFAEGWRTLIMRRRTLRRQRRNFAFAPRAAANGTHSG